MEKIWLTGNDGGHGERGEKSDRIRAEENDAV
jgi:hypothetical protein